MKGFLIFIAVIVLIGIVVAGIVISGLNKVVRLDEQTEAAWAQVENQLQRRNDLVPNLVNTVKGYAAHENKLFTRITELRSQWAAAQNRDQKIAAAEGLSGALSRLLLVAENYPQLKANENFLTLQAQLEGTENRIAVERRRYNEASREFNYYIRTVFGRVWARMRNLTEPKPYFKAEKTAHTVPKVEF
jgi:LemA protein